MNILISGSTGLVGKELIKKLQNKGHSVRKLVRKSSGNPNEFVWNLRTGEIDKNAFKDLDAIIHLAGASIAKRWTKEYKKELQNSRIGSAKLLFKYCLENNIHLKSFISASGISYYGTFTSSQIFTENEETSRHDFLANLSRDWEKAADQFSEISKRVVKLRISPVLSEKGGSFQQLEKITNLNLASGLGSGKQWFNWIHLQDLVQMLIFAIENENIHGPYNAAADEIPTQKEFMKKLAKVKRKFFFPLNVPAFILKIILGEMSEIILKGSRVSNQKIKSEGFVFHYPDLDAAFADLLSK